MKTPKTFYVGIKGVITNPTIKKSLVLLKEKDNGSKYWDIPGGRMDNQETIADTLIRELKEEVVNLPENIEVGELLNAYRLSHDLPDGNGLMLLFHKVIADFEVVEISAEHSSYKRVSLKDLTSLDGLEGAYIESGYLEAIKKALSGLA